MKTRSSRQSAASLNLALPQSSLSALGLPSSHGLRPLRPLHRYTTPSVHSQSPKTPSAGPYQGPSPVPPSRFLTALTACSTRVLQACCILLPTVRFAAFPPRNASSPGGGLCPARLSRDASHPSKNSPRQQPYRVTAASALLPLLLASPSLREFRPPCGRGHSAAPDDPRATDGSRLPALSRWQSLAPDWICILAHEAEAS